jgi:hypothetical protein
MTTVKIPRTVSSAERRLAELGELATATEWERAAIVAAFVDPGHGHGGRTETADNRGLESATTFAERGIVGLRHHETVAIYARAWLNITDVDGNVIGSRDRPIPGRSITLPDEKWPPTRQGTDGYSSPEGAARTVSKIIEKHGSAPVRAAVAKLPREQRAQVESDIIESAVENIGAPFETPPPVPGEDRPLRTGFAVTEACDHYERAAHELLSVLQRHTPLEDPVADRAVDRVLDLSDRVSAAIRVALGLQEVEV